MIISNKVLSILLLLTAFICGGGILLLLGQISVMSPNKEFISTGQAATDTANVSIGVMSHISITTADDDIINFTACKAGHVIYSNETAGNSFTDCPGFVPDGILVRNDGNVAANVTVNFSDWGEAHGGTFVNATDNSSWFAYKTTNTSYAGSYVGGCQGQVQAIWTNVTNTSHDALLACTNLSFGPFENSLLLDVAIFIPATAQTGGSEVLVTFVAESAP